MKRIRTATPVIPSLLDRLIDEDPASAQETVLSQSEQMTAIKDNLRRDLENLLNTRLKYSADNERYSELATSLISYGLPDFSHIPVDSDAEQALFASKIQQIIQCFEPRFKDITVTVEPAGEGLQRTLYVKISAVLLLEPDPIPIIFDSRVRHADKSLKLRELRYG